MQIDSLVHVTPDGKWLDGRREASVSRLLEEMDSAGTDMAVAVALAGYVDNGYLRKVCREHPDRLLAGASFNPVAYPGPDEACQALSRELRQAGFPVLKLHPRLNGYDPLDPRVLAILKEMAGWGRPPLIWLDSLFYGPRLPLRQDPVQTAHSLAAGYPELTFVFLHGGGTWLFQLCEAVRPCRNAYVDLSFIICQREYGHLRPGLALLAQAFDQRLLLGSDFPEFGPVETLRAFEEACPDLPARKKESVLGLNLARLLDLPTADGQPPGSGKANLATI